MAETPKTGNSGPVVAAVVDTSSSNEQQPNPHVAELDWESFDVPRLYSVLHDEPVDAGQNGPLGQQVDDFRKLANIMQVQHATLKRLHAELARSWNPDGSVAAAAFLQTFGDLVDAIGADAQDYDSTSRALHGILGAMQTAKNKLEPLKQRWDKVTTDMTPEWWDHKARELNEQARSALSEADDAIGGWRQGILRPSEYVPPKLVINEVENPGGSGSGSGTGAGSGTAGGGIGASSGGGAGQPRGSSGSVGASITSTGPAGQDQWRPVPAVPGRDPFVNSPELQGIPNLPQMVPAVPGAPISMLPIPPGNPYAPGGGAYVLPGPGVGRGGWIYPMPPPPGGLTAVGLGAGGAASMAGGAMAPYLPGSAAGGESGGRGGKRDMVWQVAQGVPPVIGDAPPRMLPPEAKDDEDGQHPEEKTVDEVFADWFADVANPWDLDMRATTTSQPG